MKVFLIAGCIYLTVIAIILILKPSWMFTEKGDWKEFGIGRNPVTHTWMPLWLFIILAALVSYSISVLLVPMLPGSSPKLFDHFGETGDVSEITESIVKSNSRRRPSISGDMAPGYYMLNRAGTEARGGIPKYVYLGPQLP